MEKVIQIIVEKFSQKLGDQLESIILFGSLTQDLFQSNESDVNLFVVVADDTHIHTLRELFLPIWREYGDVLRRAPYIAKKNVLARYLTVAPTFAHHLLENGKVLFGPADYMDDWPTVDPYNASACLAWEAMQASTALAPELLTPENAEAASLKLRRLARRVHGKPLAEDKNAAELFSLVQYRLGEKMVALTGPLVQAMASSTTTRLLPGLQATYKYLDQIVMVFSKLSPHQIVTVQWPALAKRVSGRYKGLLVTTAVQFRLAVELERPLDLIFQRYEHEWGDDPLAQVNLSTRQALRQAARLPAEVQINLLPNAYLTQDDSKIHDIIHDAQNKLLNIHLEHELLSRLQPIERFPRPEPLPDRSVPPSVRIEAIYEQLGWWSANYTREMQKYEA